MVDSSALRLPIFWLRVAELVFGIIAFAPIADAAGYSRANFAIWCGVTTIVLALAMGACYLLGRSEVRGIPSLVADAIWCIFWLCCAAALSASLADWSDAADIPDSLEDLSLGDVDSYLDAWLGSVPSGGSLGDLGSYGAALGLGSDGKARLSASVAFSWLTWVLFVANIVLDIKDHKNREGLSVGSARTAPAPPTATSVEPFAKAAAAPGKADGSPVPAAPVAAAV